MGQENDSSDSRLELLVEINRQDVSIRALKSQRTQQNLRIEKLIRARARSKERDRLLRQLEHLETRGREGGEPCDLED